MGISLRKLEEVNKQGGIAKRDRRPVHGHYPVQFRSICCSELKAHLIDSFIASTIEASASRAHSFISARKLTLIRTAAAQGLVVQCGELSLVVISISFPA